MGTVDYNNVGALVDTALDASKKKIVHVRIDDGTPEGLKVQVNRWTASPGNEYVIWKISMHSRTGQDGHCGNFNGNPGDDDRMAVRQRVGTQGVPAGPELLFTTKTPVASADRPDINNCPTATLNAAKADCKATFGGVSPLAQLAVNFSACAFSIHLHDTMLLPCAMQCIALAADAFSMLVKFG